MTQQRPQRTAPRSQRPTRHIPWLLLGAMLAVGLFAAYRAPLLRLQAVSVSGNQRLSAARVAEAAGLRIGAHRWEQLPGNLERRLEQEPWVMGARLRWEGWNRVSIRVEERQPLSLLPYFGKWVTLAADSTVLELVPSPAARKLPVVTGVPARPLLRGDRVEPQGLADVQQVLSLMVESLRGEVAEAHVDQEGWITLYMMGGGQVLWGRLGEEPDQVGMITRRNGELYSFWELVPREKRSGCQIDLRVGRVIRTGCL